MSASDQNVTAHKARQALADAIHNGDEYVVMRASPGGVTKMDGAASSDALLLMAACILTRAANIAASHGDPHLPGEIADALAALGLSGEMAS